MKKIILIIFIITLFSGCNNTHTNKSKIIDTTQKNSTSNKTEQKNNEPVVPLGLYIYTDNKRNLIKTYSPTWKIHKDLCSLELYYSNENELENLDQKELWKKYYDLHIDDLNNQKIGFEIEFNTLDGYVKKQILSPKDTESHFSNYILAYLYDDINNSGYYSHLTEEDINNNTIISSIKLTAGTYYENITSDIKLTVFTYDEENFDEKNNYIGNSKYTITIKK